MERIVVYEGDTAESLATDFCESNGLNTEMQQKLKVLLEQQIAGVLPKILEGESSEGSEEELREEPPKAEDVNTEPLNEDTEDDQEINESIYNQIMSSIEEVWPAFDQMQG